jgi:hypothetical protein
MRRTHNILSIVVITLGALCVSALSLKAVPMPFFWIGLIWAGALLGVLFCLPRTYARARVILWNVAVVAALFAAAEAYLSLNEPSPPTYSDRYFKGDVLGWVPIKGVRAHSTRSKAGVPLYDVTYTIDQNGLRIAPPVSKEQPVGCILFFGDSFTFGEGLQDNETMPYQVGLQSQGRYRTFNFGFHGYGPHQMLAAIETGFVHRVVDCTPRYAVYLALPDHVARAAGKVNYGNHAPRYQFDPDGTVRLVGNFEREKQTSSGVRGALRRQFAKSAIYRLIANREQRVSDDDVRLTLAIVRRSRDLLAADYPDIKFNMILWEVGEADHPVYQEMLDGFRKLDIPTHPVWEILPGFTLGFSKYSLGSYDWHPNALADRLLANYVLTKIVAE